MTRSRAAALAFGGLGLGLLILLLIADRKPQRFVPGIDLLLLDVKLERRAHAVVRPKSKSSPPPAEIAQTVAHVRFLATEGCATCVFLPAGSRGGYALSFIPSLIDIDGERYLRLERPTNLLTICWQDELEGADPKSIAGPFNTYRGFTLTCKLGAALALPGMTCGSPAAPPSDLYGEVYYQGTLRCEGKLDPTKLSHSEWSRLRLAGEELDATNCAIPAIMCAGVRIERPQLIRRAETP